MKKLKKASIRFCWLGLFLIFALTLATACSNGSEEGEETQASESTDVADLGEDGVYQGTGNGYGGELNLDVSFEKGEITDIVLKENGESSPVITRAFPVIKERILESQTPDVDTVSSATFSSNAVKTAVGEAAKTYGLDYGEITMGPDKENTELKEAEAEDTQLVIIGGGPAGLSAAITAKENGVDDIIVVEKLDILGGNGKFDMNFFDVVNTKAQKENGVEDSADKFYEDKKEAEGMIDSDERIRRWADGAAEVDDWLRSMDIVLNYNYDGRNHMAEADAYAGEEIQDGFEEKIKDLGIDVRTGTAGNDLITDDDGSVVGVHVQNRDEKYDIMADDVIVTTGGFSYNDELLAENVPGSEKVNTSNSIGATGDYIPIFEKNGYALDAMDTLVIFKMINVPDRNLTGGGDGFILVNKDGKRFVDEASSGMDYANALLDQPDSKVYYIYDQRLYDDTYRLQKHNQLGYHTKADSLEELAKALGIPADNLTAEIDAYNAAIEDGGKDAFREETFTEPFDTSGPVYGVQVEPAIHMTRGGVVANENAQVLTEDGEVVPNLYAAGEVTATSSSYAGAVIWGRVAGEEAADNITEK